MILYLICLKHLDMKKSEESKYKILSQEDLDKIQHIQNKLISSKDGHSRIPLKRKLEQIYDFEIDPDTIQGYRKKKKKKNKEERVESLVEGREEFVTKAKPQHKSKTNTEKKKTKPYAMLRQKALHKMSRSNSYKKKILSRHIERKRVRNTHRKWHNS